MIITGAALANLFTGFNGSFRRGFQSTTTFYKNVAMIVNSSTAGETYGWLGQFPQMREWLGDRVINSLEAHGYHIKNRKFENTVSVGRTAIEDDAYGVFAPIFEELGRASAEHPDVAPVT